MKMIEFLRLNTLRNIQLLLLMVIVSAGANKLKICPAKEDIPNCVCDIRFTRLHVTCENFDHPQKLSTSIKLLNDYLVYSLELKHLHLMYLPSGVWDYRSLSILTIKSSEILGLELFDSNGMFGLMTNSLEEINFQNVTGLNSWRWRAFEEFFKLREVIISNSDLSAITEDFSFLAPKKVNKMEFYNNQISFLHPKAFAKYQDLMSLDLSKNMITELQRSMFAAPSKLILLYINNNKIKTLPDDLFRNMPGLRVVSLKNNQIQLLSPKLLNPLNRSYQVIELEGNDILCCANMEELIKSNVHKNIKGTCSLPSPLKGKDIATLEVSNVRHGIC